MAESLLLGSLFFWPEKTRHGYRLSKATGDIIPYYVTSISYVLINLRNLNDVLMNFKQYISTYFNQFENPHSSSLLMSNPKTSDDSRKMAGDCLDRVFSSGFSGGTNSWGSATRVSSNFFKGCNYCGFNETLLSPS